MKKNIKIGFGTVLVCMLCFVWTVNASTTEGGHFTSLSNKAKSGTTKTLISLPSSEKTAKNVVNDGNLVKKHKHAESNIGHKINGSNKKISKSSKRPLPRHHRQEGWGCFANCLANSVPIDVVISCAEACASRQYGTCAACIGVGIEVVAGCAWECLYLEVQ